MEENPIKVLLIEDNQGDARLIREMLAEASRVNFDLQCAERVSTGIKHLSGDGINVILLDLKLPDSSGIDTVIRVRERASPIPIIVLTGTLDESLGIEAVHEGAQDYLLKDKLDSSLLERSILYAIQRKKAEEELFVKTALLEAESETTIDGILVVDSRGKSILSNKRFAEMWNIPQKLLDTRDDEKMLHYVLRQLEDPDKFLEKVRYLYSHRDEKSRDEIEFKDGKVFDRYSSPLVDSRGKYHGRVWYFRDITNRKRVEEELKDTCEKLKEAQQQLIQSGKMVAMGQLASGISHELNQPLTAIKGFAQVALMDLDKKGLIREDLNKIVAQSDRMDQIIKNVRLFARKPEFKMEETDINQPIEASLMLLSEQLRVHNIKLNKSLAKDLPKVEGDKNELQQVFLNLITNARDSIDSLKSPNGGELIIKSTLSKNKKNIEITFEDTGHGISKEDLSNVFNPFFTTKSPDGGIGLGLSITHRIIENHKGTIEAFSEEGKGATFKITLPILKKKKG